jgi:hypothetical protein
MGGVEKRGAAILRLPPASSRPPRPALDPGEPRGVILLFTGVRYERLAEPDAAPPVLAGGEADGRRRRS